jgi:acyl-CoA thioesterase FadM
MNVSWYTHLFSSATIASLHLIGLDENYFRKNKTGSFALETHIQYLAEVMVGKHVSIRTRVLGVSDKLFHFMHFLVNEDDQVLAATGEFLSAHIDMQKRRVTAFAPELRESIQQLCDQHAQIPWKPPVCGIMKP